MKKWFIMFSVAVVTVLYGCSDDTKIDENIEKDVSVAEEVIKEEIAEDIIEIEGLGFNKEEFIQTFNSILDSEGIDKSLHLNNNLSNDHISVSASVNTSENIDSLEMTASTFSPAIFMEAVIKIFNPKVSDEMIPEILLKSFNLYGDARDIEFKEHRGATTIGDVYYVLESTDINNREYKITVAIK